MEKKILKSITLFLFVFSIIGNAVLCFLPEIQGAVKEKRMQNVGQEDVLQTSHETVTQQIKKIPYLMKQKEVEKNEEFDRNSQLKFSLPKGVKADDVKVAKDPLALLIQVTIPNAGANYFQNEPVQGKNEHLIELSYEMQEKDAIIIMKFDQVMEIETTSNSYFFYLSFLTPKERYDKVVVIDPGHGGKNIGEKAGDIKEKEIDLAIAKRLEKLLRKQGIGVYCTRTKDVNPTEQARAELAKNAQADYFVSIHCNSMKNEKFFYITGTEAIYQTGEKVRKLSQKLAENCLLELNKQCSMVNRGIQKEEKQALLNHVETPAVLIRVGFLSNEEEKKKLTSKDYQQSLAQGICDALLQSMKKEKQK